MFVLGSETGFYCRKCFKVFEKQRIFIKHAKNCGKKLQFICNLKDCNYKSTEKDNLRNHLINFHKIKLSHLLLKKK